MQTALHTLPSIAGPCALNAAVTIIERLEPNSSFSPQVIKIQAANDASQEVEVLLCDPLEPSAVFPLTPMDDRSLLRLALKCFTNFQLFAPGLAADDPRLAGYGFVNAINTVDSERGAVCSVFEYLGLHDQEGCALTNAALDHLGDQVHLLRVLTSLGFTDISDLLLRTCCDAGLVSYADDRKKFLEALFLAVIEWERYLKHGRPLFNADYLATRSRDASTILAFYKSRLRDIFGAAAAAIEAAAAADPPTITVNTRLGDLMVFFTKQARALCPTLADVAAVAGGGAGGSGGGGGGEEQPGGEEEQPGGEEEQPGGGGGGVGGSGVDAQMEEGTHASGGAEAAAAEARHSGSGGGGVQHGGVDEAVAEARHGSGDDSGGVQRGGEGAGSSGGAGGGGGGDGGGGAAAALEARASADRSSSQRGGRVGSSNATRKRSTAAKRARNKAAAAGAVAAARITELERMVQERDKTIRRLRKELAMKQGE